MVDRASRVLNVFSVLAASSTGVTTKVVTATTFFTPLVLASPGDSLPPLVAGFSGTLPSLGPRCYV